MNSASSAALVFDLPLCTLTDTEGNRESPEYILKYSKNTIFNEHPVLKIHNQKKQYCIYTTILC